MRHPVRQVGLYFVLNVLGVLLVVLVVSHPELLGKGSPIAGMVGLFLAIVSFFLAILSLLAAIGYLRLLAGKTSLARWKVSAEEWERFRAFDTVRVAQDPALGNEFRIRKRSPAGVEVIFGRHQVIADGSYYPLRPWASPALRGVNWLPAPVSPECLEFVLEYPRGRFGGTFRRVLRLPVPATSRAEGLRVLEHYQALTR